LDLVELFLNTTLYDQKNKAYRSYCSPEGCGDIYPEITAYAVNLACILYKKYKKEELLERAIECAEYLINLSSETGGIAGHSDKFLYAFDTGIFISGLFDLYEITSEGKYLKSAKKSLKWLLSLYNGTTFRAIDKNTHPNDWDKTSSIHLAKLSIPLLKAWKILEEEKYKKITINLLDWAVSLQSGNGRFRLNKNISLTFTHFHCYATEGFLYAYALLNDEKYFDIAKRGGEWLASVQNEDGSLYRWYPYSPKVKGFIPIDMIYREKAHDATAQAIRIWKALKINKKGIANAEKYLESQLNGSGLPLVKRKYLFYWTTPKEIWSWPTFFYIHAVIMDGINDIVDIF